MRIREIGIVLGLLTGCATTNAVSHTSPHQASVQPKIDPAGAVRAFDHVPRKGEKAICPVSGDVFYVDADTQTTKYKGKYYAFCCDDCPSEFAADPAKYVH